MKVLVVGSGGREHALVWKIVQSPKVKKVYCAPGNAGTASQAENVDIKVDDITALADFAQKENIDLTVVGPELPLVLGISDEFNKRGLAVFGPDKVCSQFEGSKAFTKKFLMKYDVPTAAYGEYDDIQNAVSDIDKYGYPVVIKADGLAAGKGVIIAETKDVALEALEDMMEKQVFGDSGKVVVLEEFLEGIEASVLCFVDGKKIIPMESAQDYKRIFDGDKGLNTGGMGTYSPNRLFDHGLEETMKKEILEPIMKGLLSEGMDFRGVLFIGLMIKNGKPKVLEFNVRFGDPETESVLLRLESDIVEIFEKVVRGNLSPNDLKWKSDKAVCVVLASGGYPGDYEVGKEIKGIDEVDGAIVFHCGTKTVDGKVVTDGGRVLAVSATGEDLKKAAEKAYGEINKISFEGMQYRKDISK
ncbi:phosphoribosylamine--glycine ligase [Alkalibacter saccharofermentans]|uniref:Phosphoribosylamine--glycine ligase n=1 Tax=Alkalibacter saccharofermentans DSM 14828 TaxID=1120975 RepID=A0A1M4YDP3_9FIRM|nr:phosphoribosylamine--glycine ligase [Alkalibacter saccharofermentans]SHF03954.1 phosphoribosylamine--glycine ligase [Alkalibacter saccharofermentans DSM 14828]